MKKKFTDDPGLTMTDVAHKTLKEMILHKRFAPGQKLVYADLAKRLDMSKTPISNAMNQLAAEGYLILRPNAGYYVREFSLEELLKALEARVLLEVANLTLVLQEITDEDIFKLEQEHKEYIQRSANVFNFEQIEKNMEFHRLIAKIGKNPFLLKSIDYIHDWLNLPGNEGHRILLTPLSVERGIYEHRQLIEALRLRDEASAKALMKAHLQRPIELLVGRNK